MIEEKEKSVEEMIESLKNDEDFQLLINKCNLPNCFSIIGTVRREEWHTKFVKWLLDPKGNHNLGKFSLEMFLNMVERKNEDFVLNKTNIEEMKLETEYSITNGRIDIFGKNSSLVMVIENKISAKETWTNCEAQTDTYYKYVENKFKDKQKIYIHLTAYPKNKVQNKYFTTITYQELFDNVIKPAYDQCNKCEISNTRIVLEQYIMDISNPLLYNPMIVYVDKQRAEAIYQRHEKVFKAIHEEIKNENGNNESKTLEFYNKNQIYINKLILQPLNKKIIMANNKLVPSDKIIYKLINENYIELGKTELIYNRLRVTCVIKIGEDYKFYAGIYNGEDYDGSQYVEAIHNYQSFETFHTAAVAVEIEAGSGSSNPGISPKKCRLLFAKKKEDEGKEIDEIIKRDNLHFD